MKKTAPAFLLVAACAWLLAAAPAGATFPGRPGLIAFDGTGSIWTVSPGHHGSPQKLAEGTDPSFSPDGKLIAFMRGGRLLVVRSDGSGERLLYQAEGTSDPCFAADGAHVFFKHDTSGEGYADLYSIPLAGGSAHRLTHTGSRSSEIDSEAPEAAPNGRFVAFQRNEWIWTMRPDGSHQRRLTRGVNPSISPDSDQVVASRGESLVLIGAAGGHERVIHPITVKKQFGELIRSAGWPAFSPDGRSIAFTYKRIVSAGPGNHASGRLAVYSLRTGKLRILTGPAFDGRQPSWQSLH